MEQLSNAAISNATEEDLVQLPTVSPPLGANLHDLLKKAEEARMLFEIEKERLQRNNAALTDQNTLLEAEWAKLNAEKEDARKQHDLNEEKARQQARDQDRLSQRERALLEREEQLRAREEDADAGFAQHRCLP